jgi:hypothetical protein
VTRQVMVSPGSRAWAPIQRACAPGYAAAY